MPSMEEISRWRSVEKLMTEISLSIENHFPLLAAASVRVFARQNKKLNWVFNVGVLVKHLNGD